MQLNQMISEPAPDAVCHNDVRLISPQNCMSDKQQKWIPRDYSKTFSTTWTPKFCCHVTGALHCLRPLRGTLVTGNHIVSGILCLIFVSGAAATGCEGSGWAATFSLMASIFFVPHNSVLTSLLGISFERGLEYHIMFAYATLINGVIHGLSCDIDMTGVFLLLAMGLSSALAFYKIRRAAFEVFYKSHILLYLVAMFFALVHHGAKLAILVALIWMLDVIYRYGFLALMKYPRNAKAYALPANVVRIEFQKGAFRYQAGQYVFLCIPALTCFQWHPFSVSSSPHEDVVTVHVRALGDWTRKLYDIAKAGGEEGVELQMLFEGPYGELAVDVDGPRYTSVLLISGGIGITPMQSICNSLLHQMKAGRPMNAIWFIWSAADRYVVDALWDDVERLPTALNSHMNSNGLPHSFTPDTLERVSEDSSAVDPLRTEFYLTRVRNEAEFEAANITPKVQKCLKFGRPDLAQILEQYCQVGQNAGDHRLAVLVCGPEALVTDVRKLCSQMSGNGVILDFHSEKFDL